MLFNDASLNVHFCTVCPNKTTSNLAQLTFLNFHLNLDVGEALSARTHPREVNTESLVLCRDNVLQYRWIEYGSAV